jgi:hypothetical protein
MAGCGANCQVITISGHSWLFSHALLTFVGFMYAAFAWPEPLLPL